MITTHLLKTLSLLTAALFVAGLTATATAGPGPMTFTPIKSMKEASKIKVGSQIAVTCEKCHSTTVSTVDAERTYLKGYSCPNCGQSFTILSPGGGSKGSVGSFRYMAASGSGGTAILAAARKL